MPDVSETLDALERKLRELESELGSSALDPPPAAPRVGAPPPAGDLDDLARQIDDLSRFREQLHRIGRELEEEYARVIARLGGPSAEREGPGPITRPGQGPGPITRDPSAPEGQGPGPSSEGQGPGPSSDPLVSVETVAVDAGPFADLAALGAFEEALAALPGVTGADVTGFEGRRAQFEVRLDRPVALADELAAAVPGAVARPIEAPDRLAIDLEAPR